MGDWNRVALGQSAEERTSPVGNSIFITSGLCFATIYRIDLAHLCWTLENLAHGTPVNAISVDHDTQRWSLVALQRMLDVK